MLVEVLSKRGAKVILEIDSDAVFAPQSDVARWLDRLRETVWARAVAYAPTNKRPRWAYYGAPLKSTFKKTSFYDPPRHQITAAIGSTSDHALYVEKGTGIYGGSGPYEAALLPPTGWGAPNLYERYFHGHRQAPVMIKGQRPQRFMERALLEGLLAVGMRTQEELGTHIGGNLFTSPPGLENFLSGAIMGAGFDAQRKEWRAWRDAAYNAERAFGGKRFRSRPVRRTPRQQRALDKHRAAKKARTREAYLARERVRSQSRRDAAKARAIKEGKTVKARSRNQKEAAQRQKARKNLRASFLAKVIKKYGSANVNRDTLRFKNGHWYIDVYVYEKAHAGARTEVLTTKIIKSAESTD